MSDKEIKKKEDKMLAVFWYLERLKSEKYYGGLELTFKEGEIVFVRKGETLVMDTIMEMFEKDMK